MYSLVFSVSKWNFIVNFNDYQDYLFYKKQIETSINDMFLKDNGVEPIVINYINSKKYFEIFDSISSKERKKVQSFENEYYDQVDDLFISSKDRYLIRNNNNQFKSDYEIACEIRQMIDKEENKNGSTFCKCPDIQIYGYRKAKSIVPHS